LNNSTIVKTLLWRDEQATAGFAQQLAISLMGLTKHVNACIALDGELGAGKTTFVRYLLQALGVTGRIKSPTYAVVEHYEINTFQIWHFDFYRFSDPHEWEDAGFRDIFANIGLKLCEWPANAQGMLPLSDLSLRISVDDKDQRQVTLESHTHVGTSLLSHLELPW
jgi:tRNA threonylcarbamoyladenosine biosynthesis protein TsaE